MLNDTATFTSNEPAKKITLADLERMNAEFMAITYKTVGGMFVDGEALSAMQRHIPENRAVAYNSKNSRTSFCGIPVTLSNAPLFDAIKAFDETKTPQYATHKGFFVTVDEGFVKAFLKSNPTLGRTEIMFGVRPIN